MKEKERYELLDDYDIDVIVDNITHSEFTDGSQFCRLLNQQDKRIKELEKELEYMTKQAKKFNSEAQKYYEDAYCNNLQKQLAINELQKLSKHFVYSGDEMVSDYDLDCYPSELKEEIERRIRSLKRKK